MALRGRVFLALTLTLCVQPGRASAQIPRKPVVTVSASQTAVPENPSATNAVATSSTAAVATLTFTIDMTLPVDFPIQYSIGGTAVNGRDYQSLSGAVTIRAGRTSASITVSPIDDPEDEVDETVVVSVAVPSNALYTAGRPANATVTITDDDDVRIIEASLAPDTVLGGRSRDLRITLSGPAPAGGLAIRVVSANSTVVSGAKATIAAGTSVATVTLSTQPVASAVTVPLTAGEPNGSSASASLVVLTEPAVSRMNFRRSDTLGGGTISGSVAIDAPAPPGGLSLPVALAVQSPAGATLPASAPATLTIPAGGNSATLSISTQTVRATTQVLVTVGSGSKAGSTTVAIYPVPVIQGISATPDPVASSDSVDVTVILVDPAPSLPGGWSVYLNGSGPVQVATDTRLPFAGGTREASIRLGVSSVASNTVATVGVADAPGRKALARASFTVLPPALRSLNFRGSAFWGGQSNTGVISLQSVAPAGGFAVPITASLLGGAAGSVPVSAPATVTIPAGQGSTGFSVSTSPVAAPTLVLVTAGTGSGAVADTLELHPRPKVQTFDITPDPSRGDSVDLVVRLDVPNGANQSYTLFVTATGPVQIPSLNRIVFSRGDQQKSLRIRVDPVPVSTQATVQLTESSPQSGPYRAAVIVSPTAIKTLYFRGRYIWGGQSNTGQLTIARSPAPAGGFTVPITVSGIGGGPVPGSAPPTVTIPAGQATTGFSIATLPVTTRTLLVVTASTEAGAVADTIELYPRPTVQSVEVTPDPAFGGDSVDVRVRLDVANGANQNYTLFVTGTGPLQIPSANRLAFVRGGPQELSLRIGTDPVTSATPATVTITETGSQPRVWNAGFTLSPRPPLPAVNTVAFNSVSVVGGTPAAVTVVLSGPVPAGRSLELSLAGTDPVQTPVPSTIVIPAGQATAAVTVPTRAVTQAVQGSLRVTTAAGVTVTGSVTVEPAPVTLAALTLNPTSIVGANTIAGSIDLSGPAPAGGLTIDLASDNPQAAAVPPSVNVSAGATTATFPVAAFVVGGTTNVRITASHGTRQVVQVLTVNAPPPPTVTVLAANPATVIGGSQIEFAISLSRAPGSSGFDAFLTTTDPAVIPAAALHAPAGFQGARATVRTAAVPAERSVRASVSGANPVDVIVRPIPIDRVQTPGSVRSGESVALEIRLLEPAPAGGLRVPLSSSDPAIANLPAFIDIPAGSTSATLQVPTPAAATGQVTITAGLGPSAGTRQFRVR